MITNVLSRFFMVHSVEVRTDRGADGDGFLGHEPRKRHGVVGD